MYKITNLLTNDNISVLDEKRGMQVLQYKRDLSVNPESAQIAYFSAQMNIQKRQLLCQLGKSKGLDGVITQAGAMQWTVGNVNATTGLKGAGDLVKKLGRGMITSESTVKPEYIGAGILVLEPTYKHILLVDMDEWGGEIVLEDGLFLACSNTIKHKTVTRTNVSSALAGGEGLFNLMCSGSGILALESECPAEELVTVELENDVLKIDGNYAIAWSRSLHFTVERSGKTLMGSAVAGEGFVNVYRGTGKVMLMPVHETPLSSMSIVNSLKK